LWFDIKNQIWNFKKIPQIFFQKMPNIPELPKNAKMRLLKIRILLSKSNLKSQFFIFILIGGISIKNPSWGH
jgi:hypothetical protein